MTFPATFTSTPARSLVGRLALLLLFPLLLTACDSTSNNDDEPDPEPRVVADSNFTVTDTGLKYFDFKVGTGPEVLFDDQLLVHYNGWLEDGRLFDSSYQRGQPFVFVIGRGQVIPGWDEGIMSMRVGGERQLVIPPALAYGIFGNGPIPPNATLIFEVELLGIPGEARP